MRARLIGWTYISVCINGRLAVVLQLSFTPSSFQAFFHPTLIAAPFGEHKPQKPHSISISPSCHNGTSGSLNQPYRFGTDKGNLTRARGLGEGDW